MLNAWPWSNTASADSDSWGTPPTIIRMVKKAFNGPIGLDPATFPAAQKIVRAQQYFTKEDDGLSREWWTDTLFLNPPYSAATEWVFKGLREYRSGRTKRAIALLHNDTSTKWFHAAFHHCSAVCFTRGRINFWHPLKPGKGGGSSNGSLIFYFGRRPEKFVEVFSATGRTIRNTWSQRVRHDNAIIIKGTNRFSGVDHLGITIKSKNGSSSKQVRIMSREGVAR
jgi:phage N-6-adenine-methyltransferase